MQIVGEYDYQVLLPLIVVVYNFFNPSDASVRTFGSTSYSAKPTSLYNFMETNKEMASSMELKVVLGQDWGGYMGHLT